MKCPGQDTQYWQPGAIFEVDCPQCRTKVEFFKDDTTRRCANCGHRFVNPKMNFGCAAYCQYAEQCLGDLPPELMAQKSDLLKDRLAVAVKQYWKNDANRIGQAERRTRHAEQIARQQTVDLPVILMAAYLWDLDEIAAKTLLETLHAPKPLADQVCGLLALKQQSLVETSQEFKILADADRIATKLTSVHP